jgi:hypothetical protein
MATDMYFFVEHKKKGCNEWSLVLPLESSHYAWLKPSNPYQWYLGRDYDLFSFLAKVRSDGHEGREAMKSFRNYLSEKRNIPIDCTKFIKNKIRRVPRRLPPINWSKKIRHRYYGFTCIDFQEFLEFDWDEKICDQEGTNNWLVKDGRIETYNYELFSIEYFTYRNVFKTFYDNAVVKMKEIDEEFECNGNVRSIFYFDD